jgi:hypothetical protein
LQPNRYFSQTARYIVGIDAAYVYGSWAARFSGEEGDRPVADIDLLVLGAPDRDELYAAASSAERRLGRAVQVTIRSTAWLTEGSSTFHDTVAGRPMRVRRNSPVPLIGQCRRVNRVVPQQRAGTFIGGTMSGHPAYRARFRVFMCHYWLKPGFDSLTSNPGRQHRPAALWAPSPRHRPGRPG